MKHTPGPWVYYPNKQQDNPKKGFIVLQAKEHNSANIATTIEMVGMTKQEAESNAQLIAAAPELLRALCEVVKISDRKHDAWDNAKSLINKLTS